jgi:diguanylate cyclase (GGDEF)-like protein
MLVVFYAYSFSALRFYYASMSALGVTFLYPLVDVYFVKTTPEQLVANMFFLSASNVIGLPVSYLLERHIRRDFLLTMLLAFEKRKTERLNMTLKDISYLDGLTGVANRRKFEEHLIREWDRAKKSGQPLSLLMVDIDFFKRYNDLLGHLEGDECLRKVAQEINRHVRRGMDLVARYGGEEFAVTLPETQEEQARVIAERIRSDVENLKIPHPASEVSRYITVSVGVATLVPDNNLRREILINMADKALYRAKRKGRNRVEVFTPAGD